VVACLSRKFEALERELREVTEEEYRRLAVRDASSAAMVPPTDTVDRLVRDLQQQHTLQVQAGEQQAAPQAPSSPPPGTLQQNIVPMPAGMRRQLEREKVSPEGTGEEVLLQGFNWDRCGAGVEDARSRRHVCLPNLLGHLSMPRTVGAKPWASFALLVLQLEAAGRLVQPRAVAGCRVWRHGLLRHLAAAPHAVGQQAGGVARLAALQRSCGGDKCRTAHGLCWHSWGDVHCATWCASPPQMLTPAPAALPLSTSGLHAG
jgi:hypothetical protein